MIEAKFSDQILLHKKYVDSFLNISNVCFYHMKVRKDQLIELFVSTTSIKTLKECIECIKRKIDTCSKLTIETPEQSEICSKLTIKTPERHHWHCFDVLIVNFQHISHLALMFLMLVLKMQLPAGMCLMK